VSRRSQNGLVIKFRLCMGLGPGTLGWTPIFPLVPSGCSHP
jgi:hypothetical protein